MKRSEVVHDIFEALEYVYGDNAYETLADSLLTIIEEAGMLPPGKSVPDKYFGSRWRYEWESEDET